MQQREWTWSCLIKCYKQPGILFKPLTHTCIAPLLITVLAGAFIWPFGVGTYLLTRMSSSFAFVHVSTVGPVFVHFIPWPAEALVGSLSVFAKLFARRRSDAALVDVGAHVTRWLVTTSTYTTETKTNIGLLWQLWNPLTTNNSHYLSTRKRI